MEKRLIVLCVALAIWSCGSRGDAGRRVRIAIGGQNQLIYLPTTLARELGCYKDVGIDVEFEDLAGGSKALEALLGGSADVVSGFYDHTIQMAADGRSLVAFVTMLRYPGLVLATSPQQAATLTRIGDLKGRILGVTTAGSSSHMLLTYLLKRSGVDEQSVSVTGIGIAATAIAAVERGKVDAAMMADPAFTMMRRRNPAARILADLRTGQGVREAMGTNAYPASVFYSSSDWIATHRDTASRLVRAMTRTLQWIQAHSPEEIAAKMPASFRGEDPTLYVDALRNALPMYSPDGVMPREGAEAVRAVLAQSMDKVRGTSIDVSKTYTNEFVGR